MAKVILRIPGKCKGAPSVCYTRKPQGLLSQPAESHMFEQIDEHPGIFHRAGASTEAELDLADSTQCIWLA